MKLHITNGDVAADMLARIPEGTGVRLPWRDVLHEGRLTLGTTEEVARLRSEYLFARFGRQALPEGPTLDEIRAGFDERYCLLAEAETFDEIVLWFEHDLYDQLQILEILNYFAEHPTDTPISLICIDQYEGVEPFDGLGNLTLAQLSSIYPRKQRLTAAHLWMAVTAWRMLCSDDPNRWLTLFHEKNLDLFPFLRQALKRFCLEFPHRDTGLTQTQFYLLSALVNPLEALPRLQAQLGRRAGERGDQPSYQQVMAGPIKFGRLFLSLMTLEAAPFMGDWSVQCVLDGMSSVSRPLVEQEVLSDNPGDILYRPTEYGREVLAGRPCYEDGVRFYGWIGGVELTPNRYYLWDDSKKCFLNSGVTPS